MFTRCPGCKAVHPLDSSMLAQGNGLYRCGSCNKVSNALQNLFDDWPGEDEKPASGGADSRQLPVLGGESQDELTAPLEPADEEELDLLGAAGFATPAKSRGADNKVWGAAAIVMVAVTVLNIMFVSGGQLMANPTVHAALEKIGAIEEAPEKEYRNLDLLHLASSEMHSHPTLDETLVLNATIVNRADREQSFPDLLITLFDSQHQPLASRIFPPEQYLPNGSNIEDGMPPGAYLPVIMELLDPGKHAVGFEMKFL